MLGTGHAEWSNQREVRELGEPRLAAMRRMSRPPQDPLGRGCSERDYSELLLATKGQRASLVRGRAQPQLAPQSWIAAQRRNCQSK